MPKDKYELYHSKLFPLMSICFSKLKNMIQQYRNVGCDNMSKKDLDSSMNAYQEKIKLKAYIKQLQWDMAIGLQ